jgi:hypothetical protein
MEFVYVFINGDEWEDIIIFLSKEDAIKASINRPNSRVEIFGKTNTPGYEPTYNYYQNGEFIQNT